MAFLKSIILVVFCIGWVKAVQYDFDAEFNRIFHQIRNSFENAWKWMNTAADRSFIRINEIFRARKPVELGRLHKYQDVIPPNNTPTSLENAPIQAESPNTQNSSAIGTPKSQPSSSVEQLGSPIIPPESVSLKKTEDNSKIPPNNTVEVPQQPMNSSEPQSNDSQAKQPNEDQVHSEIQPPTKLPEPHSDDVSSAKESTMDEVHPETQTEAVIPLKEEPTKSKMELSLVQDVGTGDSQATENQPESDMKITEDEKEMPILITDRPERIELETKRVLPSIYDQQNIIILFLFFLIILMSIYFFLLDRTRSCPTIVIQRDLCGNLKPTMDLYKK
ncbi:uncharacterized protein LOC135835684 [Planococcus citri]|uniref:uncharacterized protein LOC135835684 n=1 Tax=Planococcus citri TaxID=170843 RepID=UPI0031FA2AA3